MLKLFDTCWIIRRTIQQPATLVEQHFRMLSCIVRGIQSLRLFCGCGWITRAMSTREMRLAKHTPLYVRRETSHMKLLLSYTADVCARETWKAPVYMYLSEEHHH